MCVVRIESEKGVQPQYAASVTWLQMIYIVECKTQNRSRPWRSCLSIIRGPSPVEPKLGGVLFPSKAMDTHTTLYATCGGQPLRGSPVTPTSRWTPPAVRPLPECGLDLVAFFKPVECGRGDGCHF